MFNLLDVMRAAQGGAAMNNMARQFGLSLEQTQRATEALMPAFALGFRRSASDPTGFANLLRMMGSGQYAGFYDQPSLAFTPRGWGEGNQILGQLFGPEVSRRVAEQTAAWSGVAPDIMKQMMPTVAAMLMGGLFKSSANEHLADLFEQFAQVLRGGSAASRPGVRGRSEGLGAMPDPFGVWASLLGSIWGRAPAAADKPEPERAPASAALNPFAPWAGMMSAMLGGQPAGQAAPEPPPTPAPPALQNPFEFFGALFETGRDVQKQHVATLQNIFDSCWGADARGR